MVDICEGELEHAEDKLVALLHQVPFFLFQGGEAGGVHLSERVYVVGSSQLCINLHDQFSLLLKFLPVNHFFPLKVAASIISLLGHLDFFEPRLDYLVLQNDAVFDLFSGLGKSLLSGAIVALVVCALLV